MPSIDEVEMRSELNDMKTATRLTLFACVLLFLVGLGFLAVQSQYVDLEPGMAAPPAAPNASFPISQAQHSR
ncbi:MAG TPA: hypothetical protein VF814_14390 [Casimicrobiaceae bacterium]